MTLGRFIIFSCPPNVMSVKRLSAKRPGNKLMVTMGRAKANGREPKSCLGQIFNFKLGHFVIHAIARHVQACPSLQLKT